VISLRKQCVLAMRKDLLVQAVKEGEFLVEGLEFLQQGTSSDVDRSRRAT